MTAAEADARFDALVSEYRGAQRTAGRVPSRRLQNETLRTLVVVIVFSIGVAIGAVWSRRPLTALLLGIPAIVAGHVMTRRWLRGRRDD